MLEPDELTRWARMARTLGRKADDCAGLAQVLSLVEDFEHAGMHAVSRLLEQGYSYGDMARDLGCSKQAIRQRHQRWLARQPEQTARELDCSLPAVQVRHRRWLERVTSVVA